MIIIRNNNRINLAKAVRVLLTALAVISIMTIFPNAARSDVINTVHNLSSIGGTAPRNIFALPGQTTEVCVFCHTPHGASSELPLWNHQPTVVSNYSVPASSLPGWMTLLSNVQQPDKGSRLCLSCHDGTVGIGALVNMPGPGSSGQVLMGGQVNPGTYEMQSGAYGFIGTDLSTSHPISIAVNDQLIADKNACLVSGAFMLQYPPPGDPVQLKPTNNTYAGNPGRAVTRASGFTYYEGVQCASCHDPHDNTNGDFLVKGDPIDQTDLCTTCHQATCN